MDKRIAEIFLQNEIKLFGEAPYEKCDAANERLHAELGGKYKTAYIFALPYRTSLVPEDGYVMSAYARVYDYHKKFVPLLETLCAQMGERLPEYEFAGFADHSPVNEKHAALLAGLGVAGRNSLLITEKYGSYVFLGSVLSTMECETPPRRIGLCLNCGKCVSACPGGAIGERGIDPSKCVSGINQKKRVTPEEEEIIARAGSVWGCDVCQEVCPMNGGALTTDDEYFTGGFIKNLSPAWLEELSDEEFASYPFSWRKREVILRNIALIDRRKS